MAPIRDSVSSPNQTGLEHPGLDSQYETSPWGSGSPIVSDGNSTWGKVLVDGDQTNTPSSTSSSSSVWPLPPCSSSSSSSSSGCGTGSDPELASECMDADSTSSSSGSEKNLSAATATVGMSLDPPPTMMAGAVVNGDAYDNNSSHQQQQQQQQRQSSGGSALYSATAASSNNTAGSHGNKLGVWGAQSVGGSPCVNGGLNPSPLNQTANHGAWPGSAQCQRHHQPLGLSSKLGLPQSPLLDWGGTAAPADVNMEDVSEAPSGTTHTTELNGPLNTMVTTTTNTNAGDSSAATAGSWGSAGGGGASLTNGMPSPTPQPHLQGDGPAWGANTYPPGDKGDTVNPTTNTTTAAYKSNNTSNPGPPRWDQGLASTTSPAPSNQPWGTAAITAPGSAGPTPGSGSGMGGPPTTGIPRPWGSSASSTSSSSSSSSSTTKVSSGDWGTLPPGNNNNPPASSSSSAAVGGVAGRKGGGWKSLEDDALGVGGGGAAGQSPQNVPGGWARSGGSEGSAESSGGRSGSDRDAQRSGSESRRRSPPAHGPPPAPLPRTDVDPRVLCNTGWGQTPVRQNTSWDVTPTAAPPPPPRGPDHDRKPGNGGSGWGAAPAQGPSQGSGGWGERLGGPGPDTGGSGWGEQRQSSGWGNGKSNNWEDNGYNKSSSGSSNNHHSNSSNTWTNNINKEDRPNTWTNAAPKPKPQQHGWGGASDGEGWGRGGGDGSRGPSNHWNGPQKSAGPAGWESDGDRSGSHWVDPNRAGSNNTWGGGGGSSTPDQNTHSGSTWVEPNTKPHNSHQSWGGGGGGGGGGGDAQSSKPSHGSQNWGEPSAKQPCNSSSAAGKPSGWLGGPAPPCSQKEESSSGWEEPSPESVRRRSEIDDGTAAWGDPRKYGGGGGAGAGPGGNGNMWNKSAQSEQDVKAMGPPPPPPQQQQQQQQHHLHQQSHQSQGHPQSMQHANHQSQSGMGRKDGPNGWRDQYAPPQQKESSTWSDPAAPPVSVDNGTSAWGKPMEPMSTWEDPSRESRDRERDSNPGWGASSGPGGHGQHKPGGGGGGGGSSSHWNQPEEEEEVEIGMWSNTPNQETTGGRTQESGTWNSYMKKAPPKMNNKPVGKQDDPWMNQFVKQFNNMNFPRDSPDDSMKSNNMEMGGGMMSDKRMDMNMGDYNGVMGKNMNSRHQLHKEPPLDRGSYYDKNVNMYVGSSAAQGRSGPQGQAPPLSSAQPNLRNPVPPPILPSQVPPSLLKYPGSNLFGPQQVAVLNQLTHLNQLTQLNQINQLQRLLLQQQQQQQQQQKALNQRPMAVGRHQEQNRPIGSSQSMMQPPRHLDPALLKQAAPSHQPIKSFMDNYMSHNAPELQKDPGSLGTFSNFPLGLNSNLNVGMDLGGGGGYKEPQSRLKKWTAMDMPGNSPLEQSAKAGALLSSLRLEDSPFGPYDSSFGPSPISPPGQSMGSVGDGWPPRAKSPHGNTIVTWPPEFRPGEPWKGYPNIDPETDPFVTPGSVINNLSINTVRDVDHLRDRNNGPPSSLNTAMPSTSAWSSIRASGHNSSLTSTAQSTSARTGESKWSPGGGVSGPNSSLAHELWKVPLTPKALAPGGPSRPPPGLTGQKAPGAPASSSSSSSWDSTPLIGGRGEWSSASDSLYSLGSGWDAGRTNWLVLKNLTPQIDGSTLRTLCMQHGPLITFQLYLPHGTAVVCYSSKDEAAKAKKSLHMCVLGNTTILAEFVSEEEITRFFAQGQSLAAASPGWQTIGSSQSRMGGAMEGSHSFPSRAPEPNQWNGSDLNSSSLWGGPNYSTSLWGSPGGNEAGRLSSPSPISSFLPVDHLTGGGDSM